VEHGIVNIRHLGGSAFRQHYILLLAGKHLEPALFSRLALMVEELMFIWLISGLTANEYEPRLAQGARDLRKVVSADEFDAFALSFFEQHKARARPAFAAQFPTLSAVNLRKYRLRYILAKINQFVEIEAYGPQGRDSLAPYVEAKNDIEHIAPEQPDDEARAAFGEGAEDSLLIQSLGNLMLLELSLNRVVSNWSYARKCQTYPSSQFLIARCQAKRLDAGVNDRITRAMTLLQPEEHWNCDAIQRRQKWLAEIALDVWGLRTAHTDGEAGRPI
jgi:hypothetical protein